MSKTFEFKQLLPTYEVFETFVSEIPLDVENMSAEEKAVLLHCYNLLYRRYCLSNVRYTTPEAFYNELAIVFDDEFKRYYRRYQLIQKSYALTDDELVELNRSISNYANNPNDEVENPIEPLKYISSQSVNVGLSNKLQAYLMAIDSLPSEYDEEFLSAFKYLFMNIINNDTILYREED